MPRPVHFELPCDDLVRAKKFYAEVFGWKIEKWQGPIDYWMVMTGDKGQMGIDGGLIQRNQPGESTTNTLDVEDLDAALAKVTANGGTEVMPKHEIPGVGWLAYCKDTEGNIFGMMQPDPAMMPAN